MNILLSKSILLCLSLGTVFFINAQAQTKTCDLQLEVLGSNSNDSNKVRVDGVKATIIRLDKNKRKNAESLSKQPFFASLEEYSDDLSQATYRIAVKKDGFKTTYKSFRLDCSKANEKNLLTETIFLLEGNSKEKIHFIDGDDLKLLNGIGRTDSELAIKLVQPDYNVAAKAVRVTGAVVVIIKIDKQGNVTNAKAVRGHPLLTLSSIGAARESKFVPTLVNGEPTEVNAFIVYNFGAQ